MTEAQYARAHAAAQTVRAADNRFTLFVFAGIAGLILLSVVFGKSKEERRAEEQRQFREHVTSLPEQQRQRESDQFWRGVGLEKNEGRR